jgi:hypothetical protein
MEKRNSKSLDDILNQSKELNDEIIGGVSLIGIVYKKNEDSFYFLVRDGSSSPGQLLEINKKDVIEYEIVKESKEGSSSILKIILPSSTKVKKISSVSVNSIVSSHYFTSTFTATASSGRTDFKYYDDGGTIPKSYDDPITGQPGQGIGTPNKYYDDGGTMFKYYDDGGTIPKSYDDPITGQPGQGIGTPNKYYDDGGPFSSQGQSNPAQNYQGTAPFIMATPHLAPGWEQIEAVTNKMNSTNKLPWMG